MRHTFYRLFAVILLWRINIYANIYLFHVINHWYLLIKSPCIDLAFVPMRGSTLQDGCYMIHILICDFISSKSVRWEGLPLSLAMFSLIFDSQTFQSEIWRRLMERHRCLLGKDISQAFKYYKATGFEFRSKKNDTKYFLL